MKAYPSIDGVYIVWYDNLVDCRNTDVYNSQAIIKIKKKRLNQPHNEVKTPFSALDT